MEHQYENMIVTGKSGAGKQPRIDVLTETFGLKQLSTGDLFRTYLGNFNKLGYDAPLKPFYESEKESFVDNAEIQRALGIADRENADDLVLGLKAKYYVDQGLFVPDEITNALLEAAWRGMDYRGAVLDGYPRTLAQARFLKELADRENARLDAVLLVENDDETIIERTIGRRICTSCGEVFHVDFKPPNEEECEKDKPDCNIVQRSDDTVINLQARLREFRNKTLPAIDYLTEQGIPFYRVPGNLPEFSPSAVQASVLGALGMA